MRKIFSNALLLACGLVASFGLASCDATFHDSLEACRNVLLVSLQKGDCDAVTGATTHAASNGKAVVSQHTTNQCDFNAPVGKTLILAFNNKGVLAADTLIQLDKNATVKQVPLAVDGGNYTVVAWSGINDAQWQTSKLEKGKTRLSDVLLTYRTAVDTLLASGSNTSFINLPSATQSGTHTQEVKVPMKRTNFNITADVEVEAQSFDGLDDLSADSFDIEVKMNYQSLGVDGSPLKEDKVITLPVTKDAINTMKNENGKTVKTVLRTHFVVPALNARDAKVTFSLINKHGASSRIVENGTFDLLALLLLQSGENGAVNNVAGASGFDLHRDRKAMLRFRLSDRCLSCGEFACYQVWSGDLPLIRFKEANR